MIIYVFVTKETVEIGTEEGMIAEDFTTPLWGAEKEVGSLSDFDGDIIVLNFWASWCPPCRDEMPDLMQFYEDYKEQGVTVAGVNMHIYERRKTDGVEFLEELAVTFPNFLDKEGVAAKTYKPIYFPTTYILDRDRVIRVVIPGEINYEIIEELVLPLIEEE